MHAQYLDYVFGPVADFRKIIKSTKSKIKQLRREGHSIGALAFRGQSGAAIAYALKYEMGIPVICVRKNSHDTHGFNVEHPGHDIKNYLIVDDFISSGATVRAIMKALPYHNCVGMISVKTIVDYDYHYGHKKQTVPVWGIKYDYLRDY